MGSLLHHNSGIIVPRAEYEELTEALATVFRIGARFAPRLIERLDLVDGDPDDEPEEDMGDEEPGEQATWSDNRNQTHNSFGCMTGMDDDQEDDDPAGQYDEDCYTGPTPRDGGPGCPVSDPGEYEDGF